MALAGDAGESGPGVTTLGPYRFERSRKDGFWGVAYWVLYLVVVGCGIFGLLNRNPLFSKIDQSYLNDPAHCPLTGPRRLFESEEAPGFDVGNFFSHTARWLGVSAVLSLALGAAFLKAFQHAPHVMTKATIVAQIAGPLLLGIVLLLAGQTQVAIMPMVLGLVWLWLFWLWRGEISLASRLLGVSAHGLVANPHLISSSVVLSVLSVVAAVPPFFTLGVGFMNGEVVVNPDRDVSVLDACVDAGGQATLCCAWQVDTWVKPVVGLTLLLVLWTMKLACQIRVFVISGAVAQWYFAPPAPESADATRGTTRRALGHALGPSFGSLALGSLILSVTEMLRSAAERNQQDNQGDILTAVLACIADCLAGIIRYLTKFATVFMAITGDAFFVAGRRVTDLLVRNFLDAFASTVWFTPLVIQMAAFALSVAWGCVSAGVYYLVHHASREPALGANAAVLGALAGIVSLFVLNFLGGVLLSVLDATFVCWALDKDAQQLNQPDIAVVFEQVPLKMGAAVVQPADGPGYVGIPTDAPTTQRAVV